MKALLIDRLTEVAPSFPPLRLAELPVPVPGPGDILVQVAVCAVCHTELDEIEGRTPPPRLPVVPGHQAVGRVAALGPETGRFRIGDRVGVAWIFAACGHCEQCRAGAENLCTEFRATGRDANGGYAEYMVVPEAFAYAIPASLSDTQAAPLLCAGAIGWRSLRLTGLQDGQTLGLTGFGASAHLVLRLARYRLPNSPVYVFARNAREREFARSLGAAWTGDTTDTPPTPMHSIIDTTPAWLPVREALTHLYPGGRLVVNAIRKESRDQEVLLGLDYARHLWMEKEIKSVANVTRQDVIELLELAVAIPLHPEVQLYELDEANRALLELKTGQIRGAKVLRIGSQDE